MPSIEAIQNATTEVVVEWGGEKIKLNCLLSRASRKDETYMDLRNQAEELDAQLREIQAQQVEARAKVLGIKFPSHKEILALRAVCGQALQNATNQLTQYAITQAEKEEGGEPETYTTLDDVVRTLNGGWEAIDGFDTERLPTERTLKERGKKADEAVKELEAQEKELDGQLTRVLAERLAYLVKTWDITEGDEKAMWPATADNIATLRPDFITHMLEKVEERVLGFFLTTPDATTASSRG